MWCIVVFMSRRRLVHFHTATSGPRTRGYVTIRLAPWWSWSVRIF